MSSLYFDNILQSERIRKRATGSDLLGNGAEVAVYPETETEVAKILNAANERDLKVAVTGGGSKLGFGGLRKSYDLVVSLKNLKGIVEHRTGDLTLTARAGTPIRELTKKLAEHRQMLPLDPRWPEKATLGGVIASNDTGPKRLYYGAPRDVVIGLRVVYPDGRVIRTGGKVVKNVAGYDMNKLFVGSMGTLGVITEVTVKLRPLPPYESLALAVFREGREEAVQSFVNTLQRSHLEPVTLEYLNPLLTQRLAGPNRYALAVAFEGGKTAVEEQLNRIQKILPEGADLEVFREKEAKSWWDEWSRLPFNETASSEANSAEVAVKIGTHSSDAVAVVSQATELTAGRKVEALAHGGTGHGISRAYVRGDEEDVLDYLTQLRAFAEERRGYLVADHMVYPLRKRFDAWGTRMVHLPLMKGIKEAIDPKRTLNDQRFVGGL
ncbi:glycolate oxidase [Marinithermofilum abyssi]|uniref:Glycolate oxidase n=1 Tax=Marinithermofilum abyssi TaxID=1571185 RepID=A0A8J2YA89_9BACL|nr:FAD-binding oxidoreductase [Marinithermofilum abyssi]GGE28599.1 glycolate oxidase [Marinithermofilum abyssi]